jgi:hypothetical protein
MTDKGARDRAAQIAEELNWPWDAAEVDVRSLRVWPFPRVWRVRSRVVVDGAGVTTFMRINDRDGEMRFGRVRYGKP